MTSPPLYDPLDGEYGGLLSDSDIAAATADLEPGTAAGLLVWENVWAADFVAALRSAGGQVVAYERIRRTPSRRRSPASTDAGRTHRAVLPTRTR